MTKPMTVELVELAARALAAGRADMIPAELSRHELEAALARADEIAGEEFWRCQLQVEPRRGGGR